MRTNGADEREMSMEAEEAPTQYACSLSSLGLALLNDCGGVIALLLDIIRWPDCRSLTSPLLRALQALLKPVGILIACKIITTHYSFLNASL